MAVPEKPKLHYDQYMKNKKVIFVGPAPTLMHQGKGSWIDKNFQVTIRSNGAILLLHDSKYREDYGTKWVKSFADDNPQAYLQLYTQPSQGADRGPQGSLTGYMAKKFWPYGVNAVDQEWGSFWFRCPVIRLAEIYLIYAEAVNELYGPTSAPTFGGETGLTAEEAVNVIRARAQMPNTHSKFTADKLEFRERIRNERSVEFCFEGQRWNDLRRWHIGHLPEYKTLYGLDFDKDHTSFSKAWLMDRVFEEKHYWLPFRVEEVLLYEDYRQNPGW